ncbi:unnamed protein product [Didymodactylos carnosus]|uniref:Uncharacterized protein n=1 Tax=Didymodactylos carnosus TaxID=1234261 RepID=A0A814VK56_9BILA|nr:unnamed protein product [Didymodactylos carnosus]CAF1188222.1 unnamed protein product [Didymodactylos carnosus]CAF3761584.1 unnamed protein product [Didymodactylos carnosus]CAF3952488.1 unnamed protein product [Didymodactylos carnosus]
MPVIGRYAGPRYVQIGKNLLPSSMIFGGSAFLFFIWLTDWKVTNKYIPLYGKKYAEIKRDHLIELHGLKDVEAGREE